MPITLPEPAGAEQIRRLRAALWQKGYAPVPIATGSKACFYAGWPERARAGEFADCIIDPTHMSTGIECTGLRAIDIDVDDPATVRALYEAAVEAGLPEQGGIRFHENSPWVLWLYRAAEGKPGKRTLAGAKGEIEILGAGQQFVAYGLHTTMPEPDAAPVIVPIRWYSDPESRGELPAVSEEQISRYFELAAPIIESSGGETAAPADTAAEVATPEELKAVDRDALAAIVRQMPNDSAFDDRTLWLRFAHALAATFANDPSLAAELWLEHAAKREQAVRDNGESEAEFVWRTLKAPHRAGAEHVIRVAREASIDVSAYQAAKAGAAFAAVPLPEGATDGGPSEPPPAMPGGINTADLPLRELVINAVLDAGTTFWHDADGAAFCTVPNSDLMQRYRVRSRAFSMMARRMFGAAHPVKTKTGWRPGSVSDAVMAEALPGLEAIALDGPCRVPSVRVTEYGGDIWLDLGDATWRAVRVTADGWQMVDRADVPLIRPEGMRPLPVPVRDPSAMKRLRALLNLPGAEHDDDFKLTVAWLTTALYPTGPYCVLAIDGEQGSGKSTTARMLRRLVDPNAAELRATPRAEDDLLIAAQNGRVVAFDNVSYIEPDMADALCRVATGAGFGKRKLYTDGDEIIVSVCRPVLLNGIPSLLARGDMADRAIALTLPTIPDTARRDEAEIGAVFDAAAPGVLAALLDGLAEALQRLPALRLAAMPRMADFARLACAAAPAFGWTQDDMLAAILANRETAVATVIEADPLAVAVCGLAAEAGWAGTATALLALVNQRVPVEVLRERSWPKDAARLALRLRRIAPALRRGGIEVTTAREGREGQRTIAIARRQGKSSDLPSAPSAPSAMGESCGFPADGNSRATVSVPSAAARADGKLTVTAGLPSAAKPRKSAVADGADAADAVLPILPWQGGGGGPAVGDHGAFAAPSGDDRTEPT